MDSTACVFLILQYLQKNGLAAITSKAPVVYLSKKKIPSLLRTGWFQEWIRA